MLIHWQSHQEYLNFLLKYILILPSVQGSGSNMPLYGINCVCWIWIL